MAGLIIRLLILAAIVYFIYSFYRKFVKTVKSTIFGGQVPMAGAEECPSCHARIRVPKEPVACPKCNTPLGRTPDGKLLIKIN